MITIDDIRLSKFLRKNQDRIKAIWDRAIEDGNLLHELGNEAAMFRKGYKIQRTYIEDFGYIYEILATFGTGYYKWVREKDVELFEQHSFERAADILQVERINGRINILTKRIKKAGDSRNDSLVVHWRNQREDFVKRKSKVEEKLQLSY